MKKVLILLTSHDRLGNAGEKTGFWLEELADGLLITGQNPASSAPAARALPTALGL
jgi:putative intracellular protease/amidase